MRTTKCKAIVSGSIDGASSGFLRRSVVHHLTLCLCHSQMEYLGFVDNRWPDLLTRHQPMRDMGVTMIHCFCDPLTVILNGKEFNMESKPLVALLD